jgi:hypothetical protein
LQTSSKILPERATFRILFKLNFRAFLSRESVLQTGQGASFELARAAPTKIKIDLMNGLLFQFP